MNGMSMFAGLNLDESRAALPYFHKRMLRNGETIFADRDRGESMCVVESGKVAVFKGELQIAAVIPGSPFGEMSMLDGKPRSATCKSDGDSVIYSIDEQQLRKLTADHPAIGAKIYKAIAFSLASRLRRANTQLASEVWGDF